MDQLERSQRSGYNEIEDEILYSMNQQPALSNQSSAVHLTQCTQFDIDISECDDFSSEIVRELHRNEKKLAQSIYLSQTCLKQAQKTLRSTLFVLKDVFFAFFTLPDLCRIRKALRYLLCRPSMKSLDACILQRLEAAANPDMLLLWSSLINYPALHFSNPHYYNAHCKPNSDALEKQIRMDLDRTYPERDEFTQVAYQESLQSVLCCISQSVAESGYMQGWNQIAGAFLITFAPHSAEPVFWILAFLMHRIGLKELYISIAKDSNEIDTCSKNGNSNNYFSYSPSYVNENNTNKANEQHQFECPTIPFHQANLLNNTNIFLNSEVTLLPQSAIKVNLEFLNFCLQCCLKSNLTDLFHAIKQTDYQIHTSKWFTVLFSQQLHPQLTLKLLAGTILNDWKYLISAAVAVFDFLQPQILDNFDSDSCMELLSSFSSGQLSHTSDRHQISNEQISQLKDLFDAHCDPNRIEMVDNKFIRINPIIIPTHTLFTPLNNRSTPFSREPVSAHNSNGNNQQQTNNNNNNNYSQQNSNSSFFDKVGSFLFSNSPSPASTRFQSYSPFIRQQNEIDKPRQFSEAVQQFHHHNNHQYSNNNNNQQLQHHHHHHHHHPHKPIFQSNHPSHYHQHSSSSYNATPKRPFIEMNKVHEVNIAVDPLATPHLPQIYTFSTKDQIKTASLVQN